VSGVLRQLEHEPKSFGSVVVVDHPKGLWGLVLDRWDLRFFPVELRVDHLEPEEPDADDARSPR
jgi:hypothetical protein